MHYHCANWAYSELPNHHNTATQKAAIAINESGTWTFMGSSHSSYFCPFSNEAQHVVPRLKFIKP